MKKKIFSIALTLALLCALVLPALPIQADSPHDKVPPGQIERLEHGWRRLGSNAKAHRVGTVMRGGEECAVVEAIISSLPTTLDDDRTLIDTNWYMLTDSSGQSWFQTGVNFFTAKVLGGRVSVEDETGKLSVWNSSISIGGETFSGGTAKIANDPINENYKGNCLLWEYGSYSSGWWIFGETAKVERYLRVIEGSISELWIFPIDPKADVVIKLNESAESNFGGRITWLDAYDAECNPLQVTKTKFGTYVVGAAEFRDKTFPVIIDPSEYFDAAYYDAHLQNYDTNYNTSRTAANASYYSDSTPGVNVGQRYSTITTQYFITRAGLPFYTASLPNDINVSEAYIYLAGSIDNSDTNFYIQVQSGMPTYPHLALEAGDYSYTHYSGNGGTLHTGDWSVGPYNVLTLNSTGRSWINLTGWTKFMLRSDQDIAGSAPTDGEYVGFRSRDYGQGWEPGLYVIYVEPIDPPDVMTMEALNISGRYATLDGYLDDDGGEDCSAWFLWDTSTALENETQHESGVTTGEHFYYTIDVSPGVTYYFIAKANNNEGTRSGVIRTFTTPPNAPTNFNATAGNNTVALEWNKGTGADKTMVRRSTTTYPTSPSDGTQIYFDTGTSHDDNTAANGTKYYYSAWSEQSGVYSTTKVSDSATPSGPSVGEVTTLSTTPVGVNTATGNLNIDDLGGSAHVHVQLQYYKGAGTWTDNETPLSGEEGLGPYSYDIVALDAATLYHIRAKMTNDTGTTYGADIPFTTGANYAPTMTTQAATNHQLTALTLEGEVTGDGGLPTEVWFDWGLTPDCELGHTESEFGYETGEQVSIGISNLEPNTTYYFEVVGKNDEGTSYGGVLTADTTTPAAPTTRTDAASDIGANQALLNQTVLTDGRVECEVRFQHSETGAFAGEEVNTGWIPGYTKDQTYSFLLPGLTIGETHYFRAQVRNAGGTGTGDSVEFTTVFSAPTNFRAKAISSTTINVTWAKQGDQTHVRYKVGGFPIDRLDGDYVYTGPDEFTSVSGCTAGTTYYFRAWSWRTGDIWADGYADDVATTHATVPVAEEEVPEFVRPLEEPEDWFLDPPEDNAALTKMPFYEPIVDLMEDYEVPEGSGWLVVALFITIAAAVIAFTTVHSAYVAVVVGGVAIAGCSALGMAPLWFIAIYAALGGGMIFVTRNIGR